MLKHLPFLLVIFLTVRLSTQDQKLSDDILARKIQQRLKDINYKQDKLTGHLQENKVICIDDSNNSANCNDKLKSLKQFITSSEFPFASLLGIISDFGKKNAHQSYGNNATNENSTSWKFSSQEPLDNSIKCNGNKKIQIIKATLSNQNKDVCPLSKKSEAKSNEVCNETIKTTELAKKTCDNKYECKLDLSEKMKEICECSSQKYLTISYVCQENNSNIEEQKQVKSPRKKRALRFRITDDQMANDLRRRQRGLRARQNDVSGNGDYYFGGNLGGLYGGLYGYGYGYGDYFGGYADYFGYGDYYYGNYGNNNRRLFNLLTNLQNSITTQNFENFLNSIISLLRFTNNGNNRNDQNIQNYLIQLLTNSLINQTPLNSNALNRRLTNLIDANNANNRAQIRNLLITLQTNLRGNNGNNSVATRQSILDLLTITNAGNTQNNTDVQAFVIQLLTNMLNANSVNTPALLARLTTLINNNR